MKQSSASGASPAMRSVSANSKRASVLCPYSSRACVDRLASDADRIFQPFEVAIGDTQADPHKGPAVGAGCIVDPVGETLFKQGRSLGGFAIARERATEHPGAHGQHGRHVVGQALLHSRAEQGFRLVEFLFLDPDLPLDGVDQHTRVRVVDLRQNFIGQGASFVPTFVIAKTPQRAGIERVHVDDGDGRPSGWDRVLRQFGPVVGEHDTGFLGRFGILPERVKVHEACLMRSHHHVAPLRKAGRVQAP